VKRYVVEIYADNMELLGKRGEGMSDASGSSFGQQAPMGQSQSSSQSMSTPQQTSADEVDDLPF